MTLRVLSQLLAGTICSPGADIGYTHGYFYRG